MQPGTARTGCLVAQLRVHSWRNSILRRAAHHRSLLLGRERVGLLTCMSPSLAAPMPAADMVAAAAQYSSASSRAHRVPQQRAVPPRHRIRGSTCVHNFFTSVRKHRHSCKRKKAGTVHSRASAPFQCTPLPPARCWSCLRLLHQPPLALQQGKHASAQFPPAHLPWYISKAG